MVRILAKVLAGFVGLVALAAASGGVAYYLARDRGQVEVPRAINLESATAAALLREIDLQARIIGEEYSSQVAQGRVLSQQPSPGTRVRPQTQVRLVVSRGTDLLALPNLTGVSLQRAQRLLAEHELAVGSVTSIHSEDHPPGLVMAQEPPPGAPSRRATSVNLLVSRGPHEPALTMPDLQGLPLGEALRQLQDLRIETRVTYERAKEGRGLVLSHQPGPGIRLKPGEVVSLIAGQ